MERVKQTVKNNILLIILVVALGTVYGIAMFTNGPWYDELYTYYYFISRGPVYAAIHWPVPNNHIGYSVLSAVLDMFGNSTIGLRGVSWIASVANIILIYRLVEKIYSKTYGYIAALIFASFGLVNSLAIQGRGYALATTCMLLSVISVYKICLEKGTLKFYILFCLSMTLGLYTLPSSCYWVVTICLVGGAYTLFKKDYRSMFGLIGFALAAALLTFGLYALVWLAIGSNLMSKDAEGAFYGVYQVTIIMRHPIMAMKTGIDYMLATPYIQSIDRATVVHELPEYLGDLFDLYVAGWGRIIIVVLIAGLTVGIIGCVLSCKKQDGKEFFAGLFVTLFVLMLPTVLIGQSVQPYKRVFSFYGVCVSIVIIYLIRYALGRYFEHRIGQIVLASLMTLAAISFFASGASRIPLADRENDIKAAFDCIDVNDVDTIFYTDDYQSYVLKFYYDIMPQEAAAGEAKYIAVSRDYDSSFEIPVWPVLYSSEDMKQFLDESIYEMVIETDMYTIYRLKG